MSLFFVLVVFNRGKGLIGPRVQLVQGFNWFNRIKISNGSRAQLAQWSNWLRGSISSGVQSVQLVQGFNWFIGSLVYWFIVSNGSIDFSWG